MSPATATRRRLLRKLIASGDISSQAHLVELLEVEGYPVTQATVSRDLDALGASKRRNSSGAVTYAIVDTVALSEAQVRLRKAINDFVDEIAVSENIVVIHTPPGGAHLVAGAIDNSSLDGVLGTVAGDDTLMVIADAALGGIGVATKIEEIGAG